MAQQCTAAFDEIARRLGGFACQDAPAFIHLRNPLALSNGTLPVLELMMVAGAVLALIHSIRRLRRDGDPINLALWCATVRAEGFYTINSAVPCRYVHFYVTLLR
jgi:hypothetical protein